MHRRTTPRTLLLAAALTLALAACGPGGDRTVAATVDGEDIAVATLESRVESIMSNPQFASQAENDEDGTFAAQVNANLLSGLIESQVVLQGARELGIEVADADVDARRDELIEEVGGQEAFDEVVEQAGLTEQDVRDQVQDLLVRERVQEHLLADFEVSDADVERFYEENRETRYERAGARHILVESAEEAEDVLDRLDDGEDFADVAEDVSTDSGSAANGGDLGEFTRNRMVEPFADAVFAAEVGDVVGPVETEFGFHVIEVTSRATDELEDVAEDIRGELDQQQSSQVVQEWISERLAAAEITVNPRFGSWDADAGQVLQVDPLGPEPEGRGGQ